MTRYILLAVFVLYFVENSKQELEWMEVAKTVNATVGPHPRRDMAIGYDKTENRLFVFGGKAMGEIFDDTWYYDFDTKKWTNVTKTMRPGKRFTLAFGVYDDHMYISTGEGPSKVFYNDVWKFSFKTMTWMPLPQGTNPPEERYGAAGGIYPGESLLWMTHGFAKRRYSNTFTYDLLPGRLLWVEEFTGTNSYNPMYPHNRCVQGSTPVTPDHLLIYGGCLGGGKTGGPCPSSDTWLFSRVNKKWKRLPECLSPRMFPAIAPLPMGNNPLAYRAVMFGGGQNRPIEDTDEFSIVEVDEAEPYEIGLFKLDKANKFDDDPETDWEQKRVKNATKVPMWRMGHSMATVSNITLNGGSHEGILMFGGLAGGKVQNDIWLLRGNADDADNLAFIGDGCKSKYWSLIHFHGLFMFLGWGLFLILGVFFARYLREKDPLWFHLHRIFQVIGLLFTIGGFICAVMSVPFDNFEYAHGGIGLAVFIVGLLQAVSGIIRPHFDKDQEKSMVRQIWEFFHKTFGRLALVFAQINISLGMFLAVVPTAVFAVWFGYLGLWVLLFAIMEVFKCRRDCGKRVTPSATRSYELNVK